MLKIVYILTCRILGLVVVLLRANQATVAEMLVLCMRMRCWADGSAGCGTSRRTGPGSPLARIVSRRRWAEVFPVTPCAARIID